MLNIIRSFFWKILGQRFYAFLKNQNALYLKDLDFVSLGEGSYENSAQVWWWSKNPKLSIGNYCSIAHGVSFILDSGFHEPKNVSSYPFINELFDDDESFFVNGKTYTKNSFQNEYAPTKSGITLGNDVWIGIDVTVLPGVTIADGAICLGSCVVSKDIPAYAIVSGIPAKVIDYRFSEETIELLLKMKWWNWPKTMIKQRINDFYQSPEKFCKKYGEK